MQIRLGRMQITTHYTQLSSMSKIFTSSLIRTMVEGISIPLSYVTTGYIVIRFTVPVLWDKKLETIVNNESSEIIRIFNTAFNHLLPADKAAIDIYPEAHRQEIDSLNEWVYDTVNSASESLYGACLDDIMRCRWRVQMWVCTIPSRV
jgi:hypothetical protein